MARKAQDEKLNIENDVKKVKPAAKTKSSAKSSTSDWISHIRTPGANSIARRKWRSFGKRRFGKLFCRADGLHYQYRNKWYSSPGDTTSLRDFGSNWNK